MAVVLVLVFIAVFYFEDLKEYIRILLKKFSVGECVGLFGFLSIVFYPAK
jgi:hypothetical protein